MEGCENTSGVLHFNQHLLFSLLTQKYVGIFKDLQVHDNKFVGCTNTQFFPIFFLVEWRCQ